MSKCNSIFGHKFEPRYDISGTDPSWFKKLGPVTCSEYMIENLTEKSKSKTYVYDICTKCGQTVRKP